VEPGTPQGRASPTGGQQNHRTRMVQRLRTVAKAPASERCACILTGMMTGDDLRLQRGRLHLTQRELAARVGVGLRTVTTWEALGSQPLPGTAQGRLESVFGVTDGTGIRSLAEVSDLELIAELARRLSVIRIRERADRPAEVSHLISNREPHNLRVPTPPSVEEDYPSDASAQGTIGTPTNDQPARSTTSQR
jgi:DNA-binding transcriptional regulator YiaG